MKISYFKRKEKEFSGELPAGDRVYAIGDVHGEAKLLLGLLNKIAEDEADRPTARTRLLFLGDTIDRGSSPAVLLKALTALSERNLICLRGNHEQIMVESYRGNRKALHLWMRIGGISTLQSFGIESYLIENNDLDKIIESMWSNIDSQIIETMESWPAYFRQGTYFFTHAGVRPGVTLGRQNEADLLWIREPFLSSALDHGAIVVHGHTIEQEGPVLGRNRIGLDTGGHEYGRLTALGLEAGEQWVVQMEDGREASDPGPEPPK